MQDLADELRFDGAAQIHAARRLLVLFESLQQVLHIGISGGGGKKPQARGQLGRRCSQAQGLARAGKIEPVG